MRRDKLIDDDLSVAYADTKYPGDSLLGEIYDGMASDEAKTQTTPLDAEES